MIYSWQSKAWETLQQSITRQRLPHALLLTGAQGIGKRAFARALAARLLCLQPEPSGQACGQCKSCRLLQSGTHPDLREISPEKDSSVIKIDQIRAFCDAMAQTAQQGGYRVGILDPADSMNNHAANSLLKTLEEPGANSLIMLLSTQPGRLPATIRSRCQKLAFGIPDPALALAWLREQGMGEEAPFLLRLAHSAPLLAQAYRDTGTLPDRQDFMKDISMLLSGHKIPLEVADKWYKKQPELCLGWLYGYLADLIKLQCGDADTLTNQDLLPDLQAAAQRLDLKKLYHQLDRVQMGCHWLKGQINAQLLFEDLFSTMARLA